jgi:hypothetical protein
VGLHKTKQKQKTKNKKQKTKNKKQKTWVIGNVEGGVTSNMVQFRMHRRHHQTDFEEECTQ